MISSSYCFPKYKLFVLLCTYIHKQKLFISATPCMWKWIVWLSLQMTQSNQCTAIKLPLMSHYRLIIEPSPWVSHSNGGSVCQWQLFLCTESDINKYIVVNSISQLLLSWFSNMWEVFLTLGVQSCLTGVSFQTLMAGVVQMIVFWESLTLVTGNMFLQYIACVFAYFFIAYLCSVAKIIYCHLKMKTCSQNRDALFLPEYEISWFMHN